MSTTTFNPDDMEPVTCEVVYSEWSQEQLEMLAAEKGVAYRVKRGEDAMDVLVNELSSYTRSTGNRTLISEMSMEALEDLCSVVPSDFLEKNGNKKSKVVYAKRLAEWAEDFGNFADFLCDKKFGKAKQLELFKGMLSFLGMTTESTSRKSLYNECFEAIENFSLMNVLASVPSRFLQQVCETMRVYHGNCSSSEVLAECIIEGKHYEPTRIIQAAQPELSKKPKRITESVGKADLMYWYTATELKEFLDENNLKSGGKKSELAQRIVDFFDPTKENPIKGVRKEKKGRKKRISRAPEEPAPVERGTKKSNKNRRESSGLKERGTKKNRQPVREDPMEEENSFESFSESWSD